MSNRHRVPPKQWRNWSAVARRVFNDTYKWLMDFPHVLDLPRGKSLNLHHKQMIAWNTSWVAADAVDKALPASVKEAA